MQADALDVSALGTIVEVPYLLPHCLRAVSTSSLVHSVMKLIEGLLAILQPSSQFVADLDLLAPIICWRLGAEDKIFDRERGRMWQTLANL